jgi:hypothetical protein
MNQILVADNALISVWVYPERKIIHHAMKAYCHGRILQESLTKGIEAMKLHRATKWLSDDRASGPVPKDDEEWAYKVWFPKAMAIGWKHWAILRPEKVIAQIKYARALKSWPDLGVNTQFFSDPDEAMKWLDTQ